LDATERAVEATIKILIADDHPLIRQGLRVIIEAQPDLELVGEASNGEQAVQQALTLHPDIVIMDLQMPIMDGLSATREIAQADPQAQVLVLTSFPDDDNVYTAIKAGAMGFLLKDSSADYLLDAIRTVSRGESVLHPTIARKLMQEIKQPPKLPPTTEPLTPREVQVLGCLAQGMANSQIANELSVSVRTVSAHIRNILDKLHLANRTQAALYALEQGISPKPQ
jgi:two-component system, NarL family, response regulator LiaR